MKLRIEQRFSLVDSYDILDEHGDPKYYVRQRFFSLGKQIYIYKHGSGEEIAHIKEKLLSLLPTFRAYIGDREVGEVRREVSLFSRRYYVDFCGWEVEGDILGLDYIVRHGDRIVMHVGKEFFVVNDVYTIDYSNPADELPGLLLALTIDAVNSKND